MMTNEHKLLTTLRERIAAGLKRKTITTCSKWAKEYRIMGKPFPGPWTNKWHPWTDAMMDALDELIVGQKAAQMAYTEVCLNKTFFNIDVKAESVLYVLPASKPDAHDFSTGRFDPALEMSSHLQAMFTDVQNIGHKRAGNANLYIRGSRSRSQLKSIPVPNMVFDEVDEMAQDNIPLAFERAAGQVHKQILLISTPTVDGYGINKYYQDSTMEHFFFRCLRCGKFTELLFPECLVILTEDIRDPAINDSHIICKECKGVIPHEDKWKYLESGVWVPQQESTESRGFHINQLYSSAVAGRPSELAKGYLKSLTNPADEQEFFNSKLGEVHVVDGATVTDAEIEECIGDFRMQNDRRAIKMATIGIDVGKWLHYEIDEWTITPAGGINDLALVSFCKMIKTGKVLEFPEIIRLLRQFQITAGVIDANPEFRKAMELCKACGGMMRMCYYSSSSTSKNINIHAEQEYTVTVDRTSWLDVALGRFHNHTIALPIDTPFEYKEHIKAPIRIYEKDRNGNPVGRYVTKDNVNDHHAHARTYAEIALEIGASFGVAEDISGVV